jgi:pilus assembly protein CpaB
MRSLLLLTAAVIAVVTGVAALQWSNKQTGAAPSAPATATSAPAPDVSAVDVLVARETIPVGTVLTEEMLDKQPWPGQLLLEGFITGDPKESGVIGRIVRSPIQAREPVVLGKLADMDEAGFLAAALAPNMRAITVGTDAVSGVAGYVFPGDRVDVLFVHNLADNSKTPSVSEVIVQNARVLAVNVRDPGAVDAAANAVTSGGAPSSITLEVTEEMGQKLRLAEKVGTLSLALRSIRDKDNKDKPSPSYVGGLSDAAMTGGATEPVRIIRGANEEKPGAAPITDGGAAGGLGILGNLLGR